MIRTRKKVELVAVLVATLAVSAFGWATDGWWGSMGEGQIELNTGNDNAWANGHTESYYDASQGVDSVYVKITMYMYGQDCYSMQYQPFVRTDSDPVYAEAEIGRISCLGELEYTTLDGDHRIYWTWGVDSGQSFAEVWY